MGLTRTDYNARYYQDHKAEMDARARARTQDPETAERDRRVRAAAQKRRRDADPEAARQRNTDDSWKRRLRLLGLTPEDYGKMLEAQGGRCATCGTDRPWSRSGRWAVDHCHTTGRVRGLLCHPCNKALGLVKDSEETLLRMIGYLHG